MDQAVSPAQLVKTVHIRARRNWLVLVYVAVIVTATLVLAIGEAAQ